MAEEQKKTYRTRLGVDVGVRNDKGEVEIRHVPAGGEVELTEEQAVEIQHALVDAPKLPSKVGGRELDEQEQEALDSIRKRPDNMASGVQLHWKTDTVAVRAAEAALDAQEAAASPKGAGEDSAVTAHGFQRAPAGPGSITDPLGFRAATDYRPRTNITEMEKEDEPKIRQGEMKLQQKLREQMGRQEPSSSRPVESNKPAGSAPAPGPNRPAPAREGGQNQQK